MEDRILNLTNYY